MKTTTQIHTSRDAYLVAGKLKTFMTSSLVINDTCNEEMIATKLVLYAT